MPDFPLVRVAVATSIGELGIHQDQQQFQIFWLHIKMGPNKVGDAVAPPRPWTTSGSLTRGFSPQVLPHQSFVGHSGYLGELT